VFVAANLRSLTRDRFHLIARPDCEGSRNLRLLACRFVGDAEVSDPIASPVTVTASVSVALLEVSTACTSELQ
jgi:hypothetical protein